MHEDNGQPLREDDTWFFSYHYIRNSLEAGKLSDDVRINAKLHFANPDNHHLKFPDIGVSTLKPHLRACLLNLSCAYLIMYDTPLKWKPLSIAR
jgi:hypothetical protein